MTNTRESAERVDVALFVASAAGALLLGVGSGLMALIEGQGLGQVWTIAGGITLVGLIVGVASALAIGAPLYYLLRFRIRPRRVWAALAGGLIAAAPYTSWLLIVSAGELTWLILRFALVLFTIGAASGLLFRFLSLRRTGAGGDASTASIQADTD